MSFVHLHVHSDYSLLDGFGTCAEYAEKAKAFGVRQLCITDHGMMAHIPSMVNICADMGLDPVFGCEVYINDVHSELIDRDFKSLSEDEKTALRRNFHLVLLAQSEIGYRNLVQICSYGWTDGFYYRPRVSHQFLAEHAEGIIACSACRMGRIGQLILSGDVKSATHAADEYAEIFKSGFFLELQLLPDDDQKKVNKGIIGVSQALKIPCVVTNDCHYADAEDFEYQKIQLLINSKGTINNPQGLVFESDQLWYKSEDEMDHAWTEHYKDIISFEQYQAAKANTVKIAESCAGIKLDTTPKLPEIDNADEKLTELCISGMKARGLYNNKIYRERLIKELQLIFDKGFSSYFLLQRRIIEKAKQLGSSIGPGRGSGGGSLVCYLLDITDVDPIKFGLLFERFINPARGGRFAKLKFSGD